MRDRSPLPGLHCLQSRIDVVYRPGGLVAYRSGTKLAEVPLSASKRTDLVFVGTFIGCDTFTASSSDDGDGGALDEDDRPQNITAEGGAPGWFDTGSGANEITDGDVGKPCFAFDDNTLYLTDLSGTLSYVGIIAAVRSDGKVRVKIDSLSGLAGVFGPTAEGGILDVEPAAGTDLTDAAQTLAITGGNWRKLPAGALTAARVKTLGTTGATANNTWRLTIYKQSYATTITNGGGGGGSIVIPANSETVSLLYQFDGTDWIVKSVGELALDEYVEGTALTDTATTTIQRVGRRSHYLLAGTMSQGETITLGTTGALAGDVITITRTSTSAQTAAIVNGGAGAGTLFTMPASKVNFVDARFDGTNWILYRAGVN
jgi:hypothetical protein